MASRKSGRQSIKELNAAIERGDDAALQAALNGGARAHCIDGDGYTPLNFAVERGRTEAVRLLLKAGAPVVGGVLDNLAEAIRAGHEPIASLLLDAGADPNVRVDEAGDVETPLMLAAHLGQSAMAELLLKRGADPGKESSRGDTAADIAEAAGHKQLAKLLRAKLPAASKGQRRLSVADRKRLAANVRPLVRAAGRGDLKAVEKLLPRIKDINVPADSYTAIAAAAENGHIEVVRRLLQADADPNAKGYWPALAAAATEPYLEIMRVLLDAGADPNTRALGDETALMSAAIRGSAEAAGMLLGAGADPNVRSKAHMTALMEARRSERVFKTPNPTVPLLLAAGAKE